MRVEIVHESCKDLIGKHVIFDGMILYSPKQIGDGKGVSPIFYSLSSLYRVFSIIQPLIYDFSDQVPSSDSEWKFGLDMRRLFVCMRIVSCWASRYKVLRTQSVLDQVFSSYCEFCIESSVFQLKAEKMRVGERDEGER